MTVAVDVLISALWGFINGSGSKWAMYHFDISRLPLCKHPLNLSGLGSIKLRHSDQYGSNDYLLIRQNSLEALRMMDFVLLPKLSLIYRTSRTVQTALSIHLLICDTIIDSPR